MTANSSPETNVISQTASGALPKRPRTLGVQSAAMPTLLGQPALQLRSIEGGESLSELYRYTLLLATPDDPRISAGPAANVPFKQLVGQDLTVHIELEGSGLGTSTGTGAGVREISGLVTAARFVRLENRRGIYELVLEPWLVLATHQSNYRSFQDMTVVEIIQAVLGGYSGGGQTGETAGYAYPVLNHTSGMNGLAYPKKDYTVQYGESDYDFCSRLMQTWGIYYYFAHSGGKHQLVLVDASGAHQPNPSAAYQRVSYYPPGHKIDQEYLSHINFTENLQSGVFVTNEFDFKTPKASYQQKAKLPRNTGHNQLEHYHWPSHSHNPENATDRQEGKHLTQVKLQALGSQGQRASASGNLRGMACGHSFQLAEYPNNEYNNQDYLIVSSALHITDVGAASGEGAYSVESRLQLQPLTHQYRAAQTTPRPHTSGPQTAIVTGPEGREIYTDEYGRVKLSFHWNRYCTKDENSSPWIRVNYPSAGTGFGGISIPRIGQEVIVDFEHGNPDYPLVTGRVYNASNMPPWELPANATQSGTLTRSSEGANTHHANALRFEDKKGQEELWLHAEKDQRIEVENCESHSVGVDRSKSIGNDETVSVGNNRTESVGKNEDIKIGDNRSESVGIDESISIGKNQSVDVGANQTFSVADNRSKSVGKNEKDSIGKTWSIKVGKFKTETIGLAHMQNIGLGKMVNVGAAYSLNVGAAMMTVVGMQRVDSTQKDHQISSGKNLSLVAADSIELVCGKSVMKLDKSGAITINGKNVDMTASDHMGLESKRIDIN